MSHCPPVANHAESVEMEREQGEEMAGLPSALLVDPIQSVQE